MNISTDIVNSFGLSKDLFYTVFEIIIVCIGYYFYKKTKSDD